MPFKRKVRVLGKTRIIFPRINGPNILLAKARCASITNADYRAHSAPLFAKLGILDIFQVNSFQIAKLMFYYHNRLLPPMFLNLLLTIASSQVHNYGTRTANRYRSHSCHTNLKQFTIQNKILIDKSNYKMQTMNSNESSLFQPVIAKARFRCRTSHEPNRLS